MQSLAALARPLRSAALRPRPWPWPWRAWARAYSVADHIRALLPDLGTPPTQARWGDPPQFGAEVRVESAAPAVAAGARAERNANIARQLENGDVERVCELVLAELSLDDAVVVLAEFVTSRATPAARAWATRTLTAALIGHGQRALATQVVAAAGEDVSITLADADAALSLSQAAAAANSTSTVAALDAVLMAAHGVHFPQMLAYGQISPWLRAQALATLARHADPQLYRTTARRYLGAMLSREMTPLVVGGSSDQFRMILGVLDELAPASTGPSAAWWEALLGLIDAAPDGPRLRAVWKQVRRREAPPTVLETLLRAALRLRLSYETVAIAAHGSHVLDYRLLARALATAMWSQRWPSNAAAGSSVARELASNKAAIMEIVNADYEFVGSRAGHPQTELVKRLLRSLPPGLIDAVLARALSRHLNSSSQELGTISPSRVAPGQPLWALLLGYAESGAAPPRVGVSALLARALATRPHLEQLRYMALPTTSVLGIAQLLRANAVQMNRRRRLSRENTTALERESDVQLVIIGMQLISEKTSSLFTNGAVLEASTEIGAAASLGAGARSGSTLLPRLVRDLLEADADTATGIVSVLQKMAAPSPQVIVVVIGMLVQNRSYVLAVQLLHTLRRADLPPAMFHNLLLRVCTHFPDIAGVLTTWLVREARVFLPPALLRRMMILLSRSRRLSEYQALRRVQGVAGILRGLGAPVGPETLVPVIDTFIERAAARGRHNRRMLYWALMLGRREVLPAAKVREWSAQVARFGIHVPQTGPSSTAANNRSAD